MTLTFPDDRFFYDSNREAVAFSGQEGDKSVRCFVSREALEDATRSTSLEINGLRAAFQSYARTIRSVAAKKYAADAVEPDGVVIVASLDLFGG
jgi:hypothetical protein